MYSFGQKNIANYKSACDIRRRLSLLERVMGIEPTYPAWKAGALPLSYTRKLGAVDEIRTRDIHLGKVALYH